MAGRHHLHSLCPSSDRCFVSQRALEYTVAEAARIPCLGFSKMIASVEPNASLLSDNLLAVLLSVECDEDEVVSAVQCGDVSLFLMPTNLLRLCSICTGSEQGDKDKQWFHGE